jgi:hypothetical protein
MKTLTVDIIAREILGWSPGGYKESNDDWFAANEAAIQDILELLIDEGECLIKIGSYMEEGKRHD